MIPEGTSYGLCQSTGGVVTRHFQKVADFSVNLGGGMIERPFLVIEIIPDSRAIWFWCQGIIP